MDDLIDTSVAAPAAKVAIWARGAVLAACRPTFIGLTYRQLVEVFGFGTGHLQLQDTTATTDFLRFCALLAKRTGLQLPSPA